MQLTAYWEMFNQLLLFRHRWKN